MIRTPKGIPKELIKKSYLNKSQIFQPLDSNWNKTLSKKYSINIKTTTTTKNKNKKTRQKEKLKKNPKSFKTEVIQFIPKQGLHPSYTGLYRNKALPGYLLTYLLLTRFMNECRGKEVIMIKVLVYEFKFIVLSVNL